MWTNEAKRKTDVRQTERVLLLGIMRFGLTQFKRNLQQLQRTLNKVYPLSHPNSHILSFSLLHANRIFLSLTNTPAQTQTSTPRVSLFLSLSNTHSFLNLTYFLTFSFSHMTPILSFYLDTLAASF